MIEVLSFPSVVIRFVFDKFFIVKFKASFSVFGDVGMSVFDNC